jgi:hypothetical protein
MICKEVSFVECVFVDVLDAAHRRVSQRIAITRTKIKSLAE